MDPNNPVVQLCAQGMQAETEGRADDARDLFQQAWEAATDDYGACIAAHYLARHQTTPQDTLHWNQECLDRANLVGDGRVRGFYPSLHLNMANAHEELGDADKARDHYQQAASCIQDAPPGPYRDGIRYTIAAGLGSREGSEPLAELLTRLCARADLQALGLLLPPYLGDLGTAEDRTMLMTALQMVHAGRTLPEDEQALLRSAIAEVTARAVQ